jgi:hypothetical protein
MLRLGTTTESPEGSMLGRHRAFVSTWLAHKETGGSMMPIFMVGLGVALVVMIVGIGLLVAKDVTDLIDLACDPDNPTNGPPRL